MKDNITKGKFGSLLKRSNKELREDRGIIIVKDAEKKYRRMVEDVTDEYDTLKTDRDNLLDINPGTTHSIINPGDFNSNNFTASDMAITLKMRECEIKLTAAKKRYADLFETAENAETEEPVEA